MAMDVCQKKRGGPWQRDSVVQNELRRQRSTTSLHSSEAINDRALNAVRTFKAMMIGCTFAVMRLFITEECAASDVKADGR